MPAKPADESSGMNAITIIVAAPDDIMTFMPNIGADEYELRAKLRSYRSVASTIIAKTESPTARQLSWIVVEYVSELIFLPAELSFLADVAKFCSRILITAMHASRLETAGALQ